MKKIKTARIVKRKLLGGYIEYTIQVRHFLFRWWWIDAWMNDSLGAACRDSWFTLQEVIDNLPSFIKISDEDKIDLIDEETGETVQLSIKEYKMKKEQITELTVVHLNEQNCSVAGIIINDQIRIGISFKNPKDHEVEFNPIIGGEIAVEKARKQPMYTLTISGIKQIEQQNEFLIDSMRTVINSIKEYGRKNALSWQSKSVKLN